MAPIADSDVSSSTHADTSTRQIGEPPRLGHEFDLKARQTREVASGKERRQVRVVFDPAVEQIHRRIDHIQAAESFERSCRRWLAMAPTHGVGLADSAPRLLTTTGPLMPRRGDSTSSCRASHGICIAHRRASIGPCIEASLGPS